MVSGLGSFFPSLGHGFAFIGDTMGGAIAGATNHKAAQARYLAAADDHYNRQSDAEDTLTSTIQGLVPGSFYDLATAAGDAAGGQGGQARRTLRSMPGNYLNAWETDPASATLNTLPLLDGGGNIFKGLGSRLTEDGIANDVAGNTTRAAVSRGLGTGFTKVGGALKYTARGGPIGQLADHGSALLTSKVVKPAITASSRAVIKAAPTIATGLHMLKDADPVLRTRLKAPSYIPSPVRPPTPDIKSNGFRPTSPQFPDRPPVNLKPPTYQAPAPAGAFSISGADVPRHPDNVSPTVIDSSPPRATFGNAPRKEYRKTYFAANPTAKGEVFVHHGAEQQILKLYPGLLTPAKVHSIENLRGILKEHNNKVHLSQIRRDWDDYYANNPDPTEDELLDQVTKTDQKYNWAYWPRK